MWTYSGIRSCRFHLGSDVVSDLVPEGNRPPTSLWGCVRCSYKPTPRGWTDVLQPLQLSDTLIFFKKVLIYYTSLVFLVHSS